MIKHIVISGGATSGISMLGILKIFHENKFYDIKNIESMWGASVGSIVAVILSLNFDWDVLYNYAINRPWDKLFTIHPTDIINSYENKGLYCCYDLLQKLFIPLFNSKDIDIHITMKEFYELTNINLEFFTASVNNFDYIELSHKTHPDIEIIKAIAMCTSIPFVFTPVLHEGSYYCDAGFINNFPIGHCINYLKNEKLNTDEEIRKNILGINVIEMKDKASHFILKEEDTIVDYLYCMSFKFIENYRVENVNKNKKLIESLDNVLNFRDKHMNLEKLKKVIYKEKRIALLKNGETIAQNYLDEKNKTS